MRCVASLFLQGTFLVASSHTRAACLHATTEDYPAHAPVATTRNNMTNAAVRITRAHSIEKESSFLRGRVTCAVSLCDAPLVACVHIGACHSLDLSENILGRIAVSYIYRYLFV